MCNPHYLRQYRRGEPGDTPILRVAPRHLTDAERFEFYRDRTPGQGPHGDCYGWRGSVTARGYAQFKRKGATAPIPGHVFAYEMTFGPVPTGLVVRHDCDNPPCTRPEHIRTGTNQDNSDDMVRRDRSVRGENVFGAKLTAAAVRTIREKRRNGSTLQSLASEYGVTRPTISNAVERKTWRHIS